MAAGKEQEDCACSAGAFIAELHDAACNQLHSWRSYSGRAQALSNQKFRELAEEFADVGLMTGDVSINPSARCIVMTTEILRSMLYRRARSA